MQVQQANCLALAIGLLSLASSGAPASKADTQHEWQEGNLPLCGAPHKGSYVKSEIMWSRDAKQS